MADYKGHIAAGAALYGVVAFVAVVVVPVISGRGGSFLADHWWEIPAQMVVAAMAALWPDVDITSQSRKLYYRLFLVLDAYLILSGRWQAAAFLGLVAILPGLGRHRGWTHRLWAAILVPLPIAVVPLLIGPEGSFGPTIYIENAGVGLPYYIAALAGYISHLAADGILGKFIGRTMGLLLFPVRVAWKVAERDHGKF